MFSVTLIDWGDNETTKDFGLDIAGAVSYAEAESKYGNTDYAILFSDGLPMFKWEDGEKVSL